MQNASQLYGVPDKTLYRWVAAFQKHGESGLQDNRGKKNKKIDEKLLRQALLAAGSVHINSQYFTYAMLWCQREGIEFDYFNPQCHISYTTFLRASQKLLKSDTGLRAHMKRGLDGMNDLKPSGRRDYLKPMEEWQIDATKIDWMALNALGEPTRYTAIAITDTATGWRVWGLYDSPNSYANVRLLKKAIERLGKPLMIRGDNGADYVSQHFQTVLPDLGIAYFKCTVGEGREKGKVERGFRTVQHSWLEAVPGFIGHNPGDRKSIEAQAIEKVKRLGGAKTHLQNLLPVEQLEALLNKYIEMEFNATAPAPPDQLPDLRVLGRSKTPVIRQEGLRFEGRDYNSLELWESLRDHGLRIGQKVQVIEDIDDVSRAYVYHEKRFLCEVRDLDVKSMTAEEVKEAQKIYNSHYTKTNRALKKAGEYIRTEHFHESTARMLAETDKAFKDKKKTIIKRSESDQKEVTIEQEKIETKIANHTEYRPAIDDAIAALKD